MSEKRRFDFESARSPEKETNVAGGDVERLPQSNVGKLGEVRAILKRGDHTMMQLMRAGKFISFHSLYGTPEEASQAEYDLKALGYEPSRDGRSINVSTSFSEEEIEAGRKIFLDIARTFSKKE